MISREILRILQVQFARKFSAWSPPSQVEGAHPQNCMVELPRNQENYISINSLIFRHFENVGKMNFKSEVCSCSGCSTDAM